MGALLLSVSALILSLFVLLAGNSMQFVILGLRADAEGFSTLTIGVLAASYYVGYALGTFQAPGFVRRVGHIRAFAGVGSVISAVVLAHSLWVDPIFWSALRFITGMSFAVIATVTESWINARATRSVRGQLLAVASISIILGYAVGPLVVSLGSVGGYPLFIVASILMSVGIVPVLVTRIGPPAVPAETAAESYTLMRLYRETPLGLVGTMVIGAAQGSFLGLGAVFANRAGLSDNGASYFVTGALVAGMLVQYPLGWLSDRFDRRRVIAFTTSLLGVGAVAAMLMMATVGPTLPVLVLSAAVAGIAAMPLYAVIVAYANDRLPESTIVPAAAALILSFSIGSSLAGPVASLAMDMFGPQGLMGFLAVALIALAGFTFVRMAVREDIPEEGEAAEESTGYEPTVFAASPVLRPMDWTPEEEQLEFDFTFGEDWASETDEDERLAA
ncbi:MFS transporter [Lutibaculum baratangense]|uniref:Major facilitator superfamily MFS_1 n=1 Tax=Lutibaculum baratangense AMV1 TaxID=631454 RepID=V4TGT1_9HYPH|nr:MFS transporter [Lutibaculum baratangense]ESR25298.1 major facilitator superfamily MFS_1 [Lutibaculum baratangense AMV1]